MQIILGIIMLAILYSIVSAHWKICLALFIIALITIIFCYSMTIGKTEEEKGKLVDVFGRGYFLLALCIIVTYIFGGFDVDPSKFKDKEVVQKTQQVEEPKVEKTQEQIKAEQEETERAELQKKYDDQKKYEEYIAWQKQQEEQKRIQNKRQSEQAIYLFCKDMFYQMGFSDDLLQYHMSNGSNESMRDLKFVAGTIYSRIGYASIPSGITDDLKNLMQQAKNDLQRSVKLRQQVAEKLLGNSVAGNVSDMLYESDALSNSVTQQLIDIQSNLSDGVKYYSYVGIYDPND